MLTRMEWSKYPLEKLLYFIVGIIPGFAALLIFHLAAPGTFNWFFALPSVGYKTKLSLVALVAFLIGNTLTTLLDLLLRTLGGAIGGAYIALHPFKPASSESIAPWRNSSWRALVKLHLGPRAPNDTQLISQQVYDEQKQMIELMPIGEQLSLTLELNQVRFNGQVDDQSWADWYTRYHKIVIDQTYKDFVAHVRRGLHFNLETAAIYVMISSFIVPDLRHWWIVAPSLFWCGMLILDEWGSVRLWFNKWATLEDQIKYLSDTQPGIVAKNNPPL